MASSLFWVTLIIFPFYLQTTTESTRAVLTETVSPILPNLGLSDLLEPWTALAGDRAKGCDQGVPWEWLRRSSPGALTQRVLSSLPLETTS